MLTSLNSAWIPSALIPDCTPEQIEKYVKLALRGEIILGGYNTEACGAADFPELETKAVPDGDGWVISGTKVLGTSNGECDAFFVVTRTAEFDFATGNGLTLFIHPSDTPGVKFGNNGHKLGWHSSSTGTLYLDNVHVTKENLLGTFNGGAFCKQPYEQMLGLSMYGAKLLEFVSSQCIILHGGTGTVHETDIERFYRDAPMTTVGCGSIMALVDDVSKRI